jgi:hypothetical protein
MVYSAAVDEGGDMTQSTGTRKFKSFGRPAITADVPDAALRAAAKGAVSSHATRGQHLCRNAIADWFLYGLGGIVLSLIIVFALPQPTPLQVTILAVVTGLSAASIARAIGGIIELKIGWLSVGGPAAVFVLVWASILDVGAPGVLRDLTAFWGGTKKQ